MYKNVFYDENDICTTEDSVIKHVVMSMDYCYDVNHDILKTPLS